jgi:Methyltransferase domain/C-methyltransferase C-terminal domain
MLELPEQRACRLSGEELADAPVLLDLLDSPMPGLYPDDIRESLEMRSPLRVVRAPGSGLVQLAHRFEPSIYADYGFAANTSRAYRAHLEWFAGRLHEGLEPGAAVLEVGCGDGTLLELLRELGHERVVGIDPGRAAQTAATASVTHGFFPHDLPADARGPLYDRVVARHVLEHIEAPLRFIADLADCLAPYGELWIEVPDLEATLSAGRWSNFYQLHCTYFDASTLDRLAATAGLGCVGATVLDVFGGSLLRCYRRGAPAPTLRSDGSYAPASNGSLRAAQEGFAVFQRRLAELATALPAGSVGYGAAERTALTLGACPDLAQRLTALHDGNSLLHGRYLAGTALEIGPSQELYDAAPEAVVLFAVSHRGEILSEWRRRLDPGTLVAVADGDCRLEPLGSL